MCNELEMDQLKVCLNSKGENLVLALNSLLNDCECSKPSSLAISPIDKLVVDNLVFATSINL